MPVTPSRTSLLDVADYLDERSKTSSMMGAIACRGVAKHLREVAESAQEADDVVIERTCSNKTVTVKA